MLHAHQHRSQVDDINEDKDRDEDGAPLHLENLPGPTRRPLSIYHARPISRWPSTVPATFLVIEERTNDNGDTVEHCASLKDEGHNCDAE